MLEQLQRLQTHLGTLKHRLSETEQMNSSLEAKQKELQEQQITSYKRDAELKAAKIWVDAWVTMKTIDEGLEPPTEFANTNLDAILAVIKENNELD